MNKKASLDSLYSGGVASISLVEEAP